MKKVVSLFLICILALSSVCVSYAKQDIVESPATKIIIDGKTITFSDVPIIINGRTLLPLRAMLTSLGIPNDDNHIKWNGLDGSVSASTEFTSIYLKVGSSNAEVNGMTVSLDVCPVNYKGRVYIPARFVAQSFNKDVVWDSSTKSVYINRKSEDDF